MQRPRQPLLIPGKRIGAGQKRATKPRRRLPRNSRRLLSLDTENFSVPRGLGTDPQCVGQWHRHNKVAAKGI